MSIVEFCTRSLKGPGNTRILPKVTPLEMYNQNSKGQRRKRLISKTVAIHESTLQTKQHARYTEPIIRRFSHIDKYRIWFPTIETQSSSASILKVNLSTESAPTFQNSLTLANLGHMIIIKKKHSENKPRTISLVQKSCSVLKDHRRGRQFISRVGWNEIFVAVWVPISTKAGRNSDQKRRERCQLIELTKTDLPTGRPFLVVKIEERHSWLLMTTQKEDAPKEEGSGRMSEAMKAIEFAGISGSRMTAYKWLIKYGKLRVAEDTDSNETRDASSSTALAGGTVDRRNRKICIGTDLPDRDVGLEPPGRVTGGIRAGSGGILSRDGSKG